MLRFAALLALPVWLYAPFAHSAGTNSCPAGEPARATVVALRGDVFVYRGDAGGEQLSLNAFVCAADRIETGPGGAVELRFVDSDTVIGGHSDTVILVQSGGDSNVSVLDGLLRFVSSVRGVFSIRTPHQDGGIEGTEALVAVDRAAGATLILVREGVVSARARDGSGALELQAGMASFASASAPLQIARPEAVPPTFREILLNPEGASDWAVYYPPILLAAGAADPRVTEGAARLAAGDVAEADALLAPAAAADDPQALALSAVAAVFRNRTAEAAALAERAVAADPRSGAAHVALSYARQARGDIDAALDAAAKGAAEGPGDAYAWARYGELALVSGDHALAASATRTSLEIKETALARSVEGFIALRRRDSDAAAAAFGRAIEIDSMAPLGHLGLGLALLRGGDLRAGRQSLETAVALDPRRADLRTWLGRAYLEEDDREKARAQFDIAREEDPDAVNAYLFSAFELFQSNRPVEALRELRRAEARGRARAVLRSEAGLGEDRAVRSAAIGRIYDTLGFDKLHGITAGAAVDADLTNAEAHRALGDAARADVDREITQVSELLKSTILSPPSLTPLQPQLRETNLALLESGGATRVTFAEFGSLFDGDGFRFDMSGVGGSQDTFSGEATATGLHGGVSASLGAFYFDTDGFNANDDLRHELVSGQIKAALTPDTTIFAEAATLDTVGGDRRINRVAQGPSRSLRVSRDSDRARLGFHSILTPTAEIFGYAEIGHLDASFSSQEPGLRVRAEFGREDTGFKAEAAGAWRLPGARLYAGVEHADIDSDLSIAFIGPGAPPPFVRDLDVRFTRVYGHVDLDPLPGLTLTLGAALERYDETGGFAPFDATEVQPRLGLRYRIGHGLELRAAYSESLTRLQIFPETLDRTTIAGFDQFFSAEPGDETRSGAVGLDWTISPDVSAGAFVNLREIDAPDRGSGRLTSDLFRAGGYVSAALTDEIAVSFEPAFEVFDNDIDPSRPETDTLFLPLTLSWFAPNGVFATVSAEYFDQSGDSLAGPIDADGVVADIALGYRLPNGRGVIAIEGRNIFDVDIGLIERDAALGPLNFGALLFKSPRFAADPAVFLTGSFRF